MANQNVLDLRDVAAKSRELEGQVVTVEGWVRNHRKQKSIGFIEFYDGTVLAPMQIVYDDQVKDFAAVQAIRNGAAVRATGKLVPGRNGALEMQAAEIILEGDCTEDYPLQPKRHTLEFLRDIAYLRPRTRLFQAVFRVRSIAAQAVHNYFQSRGYVYVHTPLITANDAEGAGNTFTVTNQEMGKPYKAENDFFGRATALAVTGQLEAETYALAYKRVYTFGPTFRAENSNTKTHAAEFWMIEPEMAFCDLKGDMDCAEAMVKSVISYVGETCADELAFLNQFVDKELLSRLKNVSENEFVRLSYTEAIEILKQHANEFDDKNIFWGKDLQSEHERFLTEKVYKKPVFLTDYPKEIKSYYMKQNADGKTVAAADLLVPGIGELVGGSQREDDYEKLKARMLECGVPPEDWYLNLRKYGGTTHSGFGLGFERLVMYLTGVTNIRDVIPFPRTVGNLDY